MTRLEEVESESVDLRSLLNVPEEVNDIIPYYICNEFKTVRRHSVNNNEIVKFVSKLFDENNNKDKA